MKKIALIGSTGSIGVQVLNVVRKNPDKFSIISLAAGKNVGLLYEQAKEFSPKVVCSAVYSEEIGKLSAEYFFGEEAYIDAVVADADMVVVSLVGFSGLKAVLKAVKTGKNVALANKESLVVGGDIVTKLAREKGVAIYPIDSEHSAVWQALDFDFNKPFERIILTASGGAFRDKTFEETENLTAAQALKHPNWNMGAKITVDSATLVNKGFEVIEAKWLFNASFDKIDVIIHRESVIHSMVEYKDGSVVAQLGVPSMELPIQVAISYPERFYSGATRLDLTAIKNLTFEKLDEEKFPCFKEIVNAGKNGGAYPAVACGANDTAVAAFLQDRIKYTDIYRGIRGALDAFKGGYDGSYESLKSAHDFAAQYVKTRFGV